MLTVCRLLMNSSPMTLPQNHPDYPTIDIFVKGI